MAIFVEQTRVQACQSFPAEQYRMRLLAPQCAQVACPGNFVHLRCDSSLPMRRPYSIMSVSPQQGEIEILYKVVGEGSRKLASCKVGTELSMLGPIGNAFEAHPERSNLLLLGGGVGIPPLFFFTQQMCQDKNYQSTVLMGSEVPFPFDTCHSKLSVTGLPTDCNLSLTELEMLKVPTRLCSQQEMAGCYSGQIDELARLYLSELSSELIGRTEIFTCGPKPMLKNVAKLAVEFGLPCQVALEEYMACGVGGCAGCTVETRQNKTTVMKRVCVDGPVFDAHDIFFNNA